MQELAGASQGSVAFVEHRGEPLEHVRDARCDFEPDGDIGPGGAFASGPKAERASVCRSTASASIRSSAC